jgi:threonine dehydratase
VDPVKVGALKEYGVKMVMQGDDCVVTERIARESALTGDKLFFPPYNDLKIIAGQGTIGSGLLRQRRDINTVLVPIGGGGLISGISGYIKAINRDVSIVGCQPENSAVMYKSVQAGHIVEEEPRPTLAQGTAGGIEAGSVTFDICRQFVDHYVLVSEEEIRKAIIVTMDKHHILVEGAGALAVAVLMKEPELYAGKTVVCVITGARISTDTLRDIL